MFVKYQHSTFEKLAAFFMVLILLLGLIPVQNVEALNGGTDNKSVNPQGYRLLDDHTLQVWIDKDASLPDPAAFKIFKGADTSGYQIPISDVTIGSGSNITGVPGMSDSTSFLLGAAEGSFVAGQIYTVVLNNTIKANNGLSLGQYNGHKNIIFSFKVPDTIAAPNCNSSYSSDYSAELNTWVDNNSSNIAVEGNIWFSVNIPVENFEQVRDGLILKKDGKALTYDQSLNVSRDGDIYSPQVTDDHTFFFFPMTGGDSACSYNLDGDSQYELTIPEIKTINGQIIPQRCISFHTSGSTVATKLSSIPVVTNAYDNMTLTWTAPPAISNISPAPSEYAVYISTDKYWNYERALTQPITATSCAIEYRYLEPDTTYYLRISTLSNTNVLSGKEYLPIEGGLSDYIQTTTPPNPTGPEWPADSAITASNIGETSVTLSWKAAHDPYGVYTYRIYDKDSWSVWTTSDNTYTIRNLKPYWGYTFTVKAFDSKGNVSTNNPSVTVNTPPHTFGVELTSLHSSLELATTPIEETVVAAVYDVRNQEMPGFDYNWALHPTSIGVKIDNTGHLTVQPYASLGNVVVSATTYYIIYYIWDFPPIELSSNKRFEIKAAVLEPTISQQDIDNVIHNSAALDKINLPAANSDIVVLDSQSLQDIAAADKPMILKNDDNVTFDLEPEDLNLGSKTLNDVQQLQLGSISLDNEATAQITAASTISNLPNNSFIPELAPFKLRAVTILKNNEQQQITNFNKKITISIPAPPNLKLKRNQILSACCYNTDTKKWEKAGFAKLNNGVITFNTSHLSYWTIMYETIKADNDGGTKPLNYAGAYLSTIAENVSTTEGTVTNNTSVPLRPTIKIVFDNNIVSDIVWSQNKTCFSMQDSSGAQIPINVSRIPDSINFNERKNVFITPASDLAPGNSYKIIVSPSLLETNQYSTLGKTTDEKGVTIPFSTIAAADSEPYTISKADTGAVITVKKEAQNWKYIDIRKLTESDVTKAELIIPSALLQKTESLDTPLKVIYGSMELSIPMENLAYYKAQDSDISLTISKQPGQKPADNQPSRDSYINCSNLYEIKIDLKASDGTKNTVKFVKPVELKLTADAQKLTPEQAQGMGIYIYDVAAKTWKPAGGKLQDKTLTYSLLGPGKVQAMYFEHKFADTTDHWAKKEIDFMVSKHIAIGTGNGLFAPNEYITRAEFAVLLARALNLEPVAGSKFEDVKATDWYAGMVNAAKENGIISGCNRSFNPNAKITREEMAVMMVNALKLKQKLAAQDNTEAGKFLDDSSISPWAYQCVYEAKQLGLIADNNGGYFAPKENETRAEAVIMLKRLYDKIE